MKTDEELKIIAQDLYTDKIFCDRHLRYPKSELNMVFMIILLMEKKDALKFQKEKPAFIYEYMNKAMPGSINGYPMFLSMQYLNQNDSEKMWKYHEKIKSSIDNALKDE